MNFIIRLLINALLVFVISQVLPGVTIANYGSAIWVAMLLGLMNALVKPILVFLTLPATVVTLGLFLFVINALIILMVDYFVPNFTIDNFGWALIFSIMLSAFTSFTNRLIRNKQEKIEHDKGYTKVDSKTIIINSKSSEKV